MDHHKNNEQEEADDGWKMDGNERSLIFIQP